jgi:hypothetical protein
MEQFGDGQVRDLIVDRRAEEDDPLVEETRVDVEGALTVRGLLDHHRNQRAHRCSLLLWLQAFVRVFTPAGQGVGAHACTCSRPSLASSATDSHATDSIGTP